MIFLESPSNFERTSHKQTALLANILHMHIALNEISHEACSVQMVGTAALHSECLTVLLESIDLSC